MENIQRRPLITFMLIAYNQERFIAEAVQGAFNQIYSPLEIVLSDDYSADRTYEIMQEMAAKYRGPHTIVLNRNDNNLGLIEHINHVMEFAKGELIVIAAGDDISLPERVKEVFQCYENNDRQICSIYSQVYNVDENGQTINITKNAHDPNKFSLRYLAERQSGVLGAAHTWHREVFDYFGAMNPLPIHGEDGIIPFRSRLLGNVFFIDKPLVKYRSHNNNIWAPPISGSLSSNSKWLQKRSGERLLSNIKITQNKLNDLELFLSRNPTKNNQYSLIRLLLQDKLDQYSLESKFVQSNLIGQIGVIVESLRLGTRIITLLRWIFQYDMPFLFYLLNQRRRAQFHNKS
ncbi:MAG: glycosyltransferase [Anaerolineaceae bacterium]